jgi:hypothetical protein
MALDAEQYTKLVDAHRSVCQRNAELTIEVAELKRKLAKALVVQSTKVAMDFVGQGTPIPGQQTLDFAK